MKKIYKLLICVLVLTMITGCSQATSKRNAKEIIEDMILYYGTYESKSKDKVNDLLEELEDVDSSKAKQWDEIMKYWQTNHEKLEINNDVLPDGLDKSDKLCIVVLGYQLNDDGTMQDELIGRLKVALDSANKYPNAYVACTGGGTAKDNSNVTEADQMAQWLIDNGLNKDRLIIENKSSSTVENAKFTYNILRKKYQDIDKIAIVTSDYHIERGSLLYKAQLVLSAAKNNDKSIQIVSKLLIKPTRIVNHFYGKLVGFAKYLVMSNLLIRFMMKSIQNQNYKRNKIVPFYNLISIF